MSTLAVEGRVITSTAVDRREVVNFAPSYTVTAIENRIHTTILAAEDHEVNFTDLPGNKAKHLLFSLSEGEVTITLLDDASATTTYDVTPSGLLIFMNTLITGFTITGVGTSSIYDLIAGA